MPHCEIIVAVDKNGAIGKDNALPWRIGHDLRRFKETTLRHPVIMGRKTWDSIGRPLPGRTNIIISRQQNWRPPGGQTADSLKAAFALALAQNPDKIFIIGGAQIYRLALPYADILHITEVDLTVDGADAFFPPLHPAEWRELTREYHAAEGETPAYSFIKHRRILEAPKLP